MQSTCRAPIPPSSSPPPWATEPGSGCLEPAWRRASMARPINIVMNANPQPLRQPSGLEGGADVSAGTATAAWAQRCLSAVVRWVLAMAMGFGRIALRLWPWAHPKPAPAALPLSHPMQRAATPPVPVLLQPPAGASSQGEEGAPPVPGAGGALVAQLRQKLAAARASATATQQRLSQRERQVAALEAACARADARAATAAQARARLEEEVAALREAYDESAGALQDAQCALKRLQSLERRQRDEACERIAEAEGRLAELEHAYAADLERAVRRSTQRVLSIGPCEGAVDGSPATVVVSRPKPPGARRAGAARPSA